MSPLAPGWLVAAPPLHDPNFERSVVLLASHGDDGAFGWVVNGPAVMSIAELLVRAELEERAPDIGGTVHYGGPVSQEQVWLLYPTAQRVEGLDGQVEVAPGTTATSARSVLEAVARREGPSTLVGLVGYAGWGPGQLEREIQLGAWLPTDHDGELLFFAPRDELWARAFERMGTTPLGFVSRTVGSA